MNGTDLDEGGGGDLDFSAPVIINGIPIASAAPGTPETGNGVPGTPAPAAPAGPDFSGRFDAMQTRLDELAAENAQLKRMNAAPQGGAPGVFPGTGTPVAPSAPTGDPAAQRDALAKNIEQQFLRDGIGPTLINAMIGMQQWTQQVVAQSIQQSVFPLAAGGARGAINAFRDAQRAAPGFDAIAQEFDAIVAATPQEQIADLQRTGQIDAAARATWEQATGRALANGKLAPKAPAAPGFGMPGGRQIPPPYAVGGAAPMNVQVGNRNMTLTPMQQEMYEAGLGAGWTPQDSLKYALEEGQ